MCQWQARAYSASSMFRWCFPATMKPGQQPLRFLVRPTWVQHAQELLAPILGSSLPAGWRTLAVLVLVLQTAWHWQLLHSPGLPTSLTVQADLCCCRRDVHPCEVASHAFRSSLYLTASSFSTDGSGSSGLAAREAVSRLKMPLIPSP